MKTIVLIAFLMLGFQTINAQTFNPNLAAKLQHTLDSLVSKSLNTKGISASVYYPGQGIWTGSAGYSHDEVKLTASMEMGLASNSKLFTSVILLMLAEHNIINLDDKINKWLMPFANVDSTITIRQLLNHTSGVADMYITQAQTDSISKDPNRVWAPEEVLKWIGTKSFNPGASYSYSNTNYILAGMVAQSITGIHIAQLIRDSILTPLHLNNTFFPTYETIQGTIAHPWRNGVDIDSMPRTSLHSAIGGAGAIYSTPEDMANWYIALMNGQVLNANSMVQLTAFGATSNYGLGISKFVFNGKTVWGHGGNLPEGIRSRVLYDPAMNLFVCGLANSNPSGVDGITVLIHKALLDNLHIITGSTTATAITKYSGSQTITVDSIAPGKYLLRDYTRGNGIETYDMNLGTDLTTAVDFTNTTNLWNTTTNYDNGAYDAHWGMEKTYDYFFNIHNRNSIDNKGMKIINYVHFETAGNFEAGRLQDATVAYNDGTNKAGGYKVWTPLDICGHEFTHGVTANSAGLHYGSESGSLNESFSDIFATCIEFYAKPTTANFIIADENAFTAGTYMRSMSNPNAKLQPDTYLGTNWYSAFGDFGGVHKNNSVQNFWFYLLCQGGSGTNDINNTYNITGIGIQKAEKIAYRNLTVYLSAFSNFADARRYSIQAAQDLYGACSQEVISTTNAWYAVGVGAAYTPAVKADLTVSAISSCTAPFDIRFTSLSNNSTSVTWNFGDGTTSTEMNPKHTYTQPNKYTVKLVASSTCGVDSIIKQNYISIATPTAPSVVSDSACTSKTLKLSATGSGNLQWFTQITGGMLLDTGKTLIVPYLDTTQTFYVDDQITGSTSNLGPKQWAGLYGGFDLQYAVFDVLQACTIKTVKTYSAAKGPRNLVLRNNKGNVLKEFIVNVDSGNVTIPLDLYLEAGVGYHLGGDTLKFGFDNFNISYPYTLPGVLSITGNTVSQKLFLFFYDLEIETAPCVSMRTPVVAKIDNTMSNCVTTDVSHNTSSDIEVYPNPVHDIANIKINNIANGEYKLNVINNIGQIVASTTTLIKNNTLHYTIEINNFEKGIYYLSIESDRTKRIEKIIKN